MMMRTSFLAHFASVSIENIKKIPRLLSPMLLENPWKTAFQVGISVTVTWFRATNHKQISNTLVLLISSIPDEYGTSPIYFMQTG